MLADLRAAKSAQPGFAALATGVLAHDSALVAAAEGKLALAEAWSMARSPSDVAASALARGLRFDATSVARSAESFAREGDPAARANLALALGLAGADAFLPALRAASAGEVHPLEARDVLIARVLLGDETAAPDALALLAGTKSLLVADFAADALAAAGDARTLAGLLDLVRDEDAPSARRARAVRALGGAADASPLPWNEPLRAGAHFGAPFESWTFAVAR